MSEKEQEKAPPPRKKKHHDHAGHGGAWKVAFADFMTSMFALFLVLWIISSTSASQKQAIAQYFRNPTIFQAGSNSPIDLGGMVRLPKDDGERRNDSPRDRDQESIDQLEEELKQDSALKSLGSQFQTKMTDQGLEIELSDAQGLGTFEIGSARINSKMYDPLDHLAQSLKGLPNRIVVAGHTDQYGYSGSGYTNWQLSSDRANAVRNYLSASGLDSTRFNAVVGYGATELKNGGDPYAPENRRVTLLIMKEGKGFRMGDK